MNEQIREIAIKAKLMVASYTGELTQSEQMFAELLIKECADISDASFHDGSAGYLAILKHFGVE